MTAVVIRNVYGTRYADCTSGGQSVRVKQRSGENLVDSLARELEDMRARIAELTADAAIVASALESLRGAA